MERVGEQEWCWSQEEVDCIGLLYESLSGTLPSLLEDLVSTCYIVREAEFQDLECRRHWLCRFMVMTL